MPESSDAVRLLLDFLNSVDVEEGTDLLADGPEGLADWLVAHDLCHPIPAPTSADAQAVFDLRRGLRALALANNHEPVDPADIRAAQDVLSAIAFRVELPAGVQSGPTLTTKSGPVPDALGQIASAYFTAAVRGEWPRVRRCPAHDCAWVFWDASKNGSRRWCSMRVCGNRAKTRAFAERQATGRTSTR